MINNKSPFAASSWSHTYLLINDARSLEHKVLSFHLLSKSVKTEVQNVIIVSLLCGIETWPLALWEENRLSA